MKAPFHLPRILALFLSVCLVLPGNPAFALRGIQKKEAGLEELEGKLRKEDNATSADRVSPNEASLWNAQRLNRVEVSIVGRFGLFQRRARNQLLKEILVFRAVHFTPALEYPELAASDQAVTERLNAIFSGRRFGVVALAKTSGGRLVGYGIAEADTGDPRMATLSELAVDPANRSSFLLPIRLWEAQLRALRASGRFARIELFDVSRSKVGDVAKKRFGFVRVEDTNRYVLNLAEAVVEEGVERNSGAGLEEGDDQSFVSRRGFIGATVATAAGVLLKEKQTEGSLRVKTNEAPLEKERALVTLPGFWPQPAEAGRATQILIHYVSSPGIKRVQRYEFFRELLAAYPKDIHVVAAVTTLPEEKQMLRKDLKRLMDELGRSFTIIDVPEVREHDQLTPWAGNHSFVVYSADGTQRKIVTSLESLYRHKDLLLSEGTFRVPLRADRHVPRRLSNRLKISRGNLDWFLRAGDVLFVKGKRAQRAILFAENLRGLNARLQIRNVNIEERIEKLLPGSKVFILRSAGARTLKDKEIGSRAALNDTVTLVRNRKTGRLVALVGSVERAIEATRARAPDHDFMALKRKLGLKTEASLERDGDLLHAGESLDILALELRFSEGLQKKLGEKIQVVRIPWAGRGRFLITYNNPLFVNEETVVLPHYGLPMDQIARRVWEDLGFRVITVDASFLVDLGAGLGSTVLTLDRSFREPAGRRAGLEEGRVQAHPQYPFLGGSEPAAEARINSRIMQVASQRTGGYPEKVVLANVVSLLRGHLTNAQHVPLMSQEMRDLLEDIQRNTDTGEVRPKAVQEDLLNYIAHASVVRSSGAGLEEVVGQVRSNRVVVIHDSAFGRVPGLEGVVAELQRVGLEENVLVLRSDVTAEYLDQLVIRLLGIPGLIVTTYVGVKDSVIEQFHAKLRLFRVQVAEGRLGELKAIVRTLLAHLGVPRKSITPAAVGQLIEGAHRLRTSA